MQNFLNPYVSEFSNYEQDRYANYIYQNKTIRNTLNNADRNASSAEEHLKKAKEYQDGDKVRFEEECHSATEDAINSTEKYLKVIANMKKVEKSEFEVLHENSVKKYKETVRNTHILSGINKALKEDSIFSEDEMDFLDSFTDKESYCFTSHTGLAYGNVHPTLDEAEKAVSYMRKAKESTKIFRERVYTNKILSHIAI